MKYSDINHMEGPNLVLRLVRPADAEYIHGLRMAPAYNTHLSEVTGTADDQRRWIENYKAREATGTEFYYVIERHDGQRCGVVRLYDITQDSFTWGSWILDNNKPRKAALESAVLVYQIAFEILNLKIATFDVRNENDGTIKFHRRFGVTEIRTDPLDTYFTYDQDQFQTSKAHFMKMLNHHITIEGDA